MTVWGRITSMAGAKTGESPLAGMGAGPAAMGGAAAATGAGAAATGAGAAARSGD